MAWQQKNDRDDIRVESAVVPFCFSISLDQISRTVDIAAKVNAGGLITEGFGLSSGDSLSVVIPKTAVYRLFVGSRWLVIAGDAMHLGVGFTVGGVSFANIIAFTEGAQGGAAANQHFAINCYTEYKLTEGDTLSFVSFSELSPSFVSVSEVDICSIRPVLK